MSCKNLARTPYNSLFRPEARVSSKLLSTDVRKHCSIFNIFLFLHDLCFQVVESYPLFYDFVAFNCNPNPRNESGKKQMYLVQNEPRSVNVYPAASCHRQEYPVEEAERWHESSGEQEHSSSGCTEAQLLQFLQPFCLRKYLLHRMNQLLPQRMLTWVMQIMLFKKVSTPLIVTSPSRHWARHMSQYLKQLWQYVVQITKIVNSWRNGDVIKLRIMQNSRSKQSYHYPTMEVQ